MSWRLPSSVFTVLAVLVVGAAGALADPFRPYDRFMEGLLDKWTIPGAALAVARDGDIVLERAYGVADEKTGEAVEPTSLFRIASLSKPLTAVAVMKLIEDNGLDLDEAALAVIYGDRAARVARGDHRLTGITVRQLLEHTGGWDREISGDPMWDDVDGGDEDCSPAIEKRLSRPLDFAPGRRYAYSNFGYCLLGRVIEAASDRPCEIYVRDIILRPAGIDTMQIGSPSKAGRARGEVAYHDRARGQAYGRFSPKAMDAHGGWIASAPDLVRFVLAVDGNPVPPDLLNGASIDTMTARPQNGLWKGRDWYYAKGWSVRPRGRRGKGGKEANWWHGGSLPGSAALLVRSHHGFAWAALFNARPLAHDSFLAELNDGLWEALARVKDWP